MAQLSKVLKVVCWAGSVNVRHDKGLVYPTVAYDSYFGIRSTPVLPQ